MKYIAFDVETPNFQNNRMSSIGISVIENGQIIENYATLINPEQDFDVFNIQLTGITPEMVSNKPTFSEIWPTIAFYFNQGPLIAHNAAFDMRVLAKCLRAYEIKWQPIKEYTCTCQLSRKYLPQIENHKLDTLCDYYDISLDHHKADSDAQACAEIFIHLLDKCPDISSHIKSYDFIECKTLPCRRKK